MKKLITYIIGLIFILPNVFAQNTCEGSGTFDNSVIANYTASTVFGDGTAGFVTVCIEAGSVIGADKCTGNDEGIIIRESDGTLLGYVTAATALPVCYTSTVNDGLMWVSDICATGSTFDISWSTADGVGTNVCVPCTADSECPAGQICDAGDCVDTPCTGDADCPTGYKCGTGGTCVPACDYTGATGNVNNDITSSSNVNECGTAFATCNYGASPGGCAGQRAMGTDLMNDLDCNLSTQTGGGSDGADAGFSIENEIYYVICADSVGAWDLEITGSNCVSSTGGATTNGYQVGIWQGNPDGTSLNTLLAGGNAGQNLTGTQTVSFTTTDPNQCIFLMIDGYAGTQCEFNVKITPMAGQECTFYNPPFLPVTLISFEGLKQKDKNLISWTTASEQNNDYFIIEYSSNGIDWEEIQKISGAGNSNTENSYYTSHRDYKKSINYYRLKQVDYDGTTTNHGIVSIDNRTDVYLIKIVNPLGQEVNESYKGIIIEYFSDGSTVKRFKR